LSFLCAPDGYTLLLALSSVAIVPEADKIFEHSRMYRLVQLVPIARFTADPTVLVVRADSPWKTFREFIDYVKAHPGGCAARPAGPSRWSARIP
jgi:tripartite-type tricarboxylate transporter receptor subunit TctC